jgi:hypothetical protein
MDLDVKFIRMEIYILGISIKTKNMESVYFIGLICANHLLLKMLKFIFSTIPASGGVDYQMVKESIIKSMVTYNLLRRFIFRKI